MFVFGPAGLFGVLFTVTFVPGTLLILCLCSNTLAGAPAPLCLLAGCCEQSVQPPACYWT